MTANPDQNLNKDERDEVHKSRFDPRDDFTTLIANKRFDPFCFPQKIAVVIVSEMPVQPCQQDQPLFEFFE